MAASHHDGCCIMIVVLLQNVISFNRSHWEANGLKTTAQYRLNKQKSVFFRNEQKNIGQFQSIELNLCNSFSYLLYFSSDTISLTIQPFIGFRKFTNNLLGVRVMRQNGKNIQFIAKSCSILNRTQVSWRSGVGIFWGVFVENVINTSDASLSKPYQFHIFWHRGILGAIQSLGVTQSNSDSFNLVWILFWFDFLFYLRFFDDDHYCCIEVWNVFAIIIIVWFNVSVPIERIWMVRVCFEFVVCIKCFVFSLKCTCSECFFSFHAFNQTHTLSSLNSHFPKSRAIFSVRCFYFTVE